MNIYGIIPARSGSKGIPNKNIRPIAGKELMGYSIEFARTMELDRVFCSTNSEQYAEIARKFGAEVPFLRSEIASTDKAMEEDILMDLYTKFDVNGIEYPDLFIWLRPTFIFRRKDDVRECIKRMAGDSSLTAMRIVTEAESRLYMIKNNKLIPSFNDCNKSMIRRQDIEKKYRVFNTDVFRGKPKNDGPDFLGRNIGCVIAPKLSGLDIDDEFDLNLISNILESNPGILNEYM